MAKHDLSGKHLVEQHADEWARWILKKPTVRVVEKLSEGLQFVGREGDVILRVDDEGEEFILHIELQYRFQNDMPLRVLVYYALESQEFGLPVIPVVVYCRPPSNNTVIDTSYHTEFRGVTAHLDFLVIRLWEIDGHTLLNDPNGVGLLPLLPLMANVSQSDVVEASKTLRVQQSDERKHKILALYAKIIFGREFAQKLLDVYMLILDEIIMETPIYDEVFGKGVEQGIEQGVQIVEDAILTVIETRFGIVTDELSESVRMIDDADPLNQLLSFSLVAPSVESVAAYIADLE